MSIYNLTAFEKKSQPCINMALGLTPSRTILQKCNTALTNDFQKMEINIALSIFRIRLCSLGIIELLIFLILNYNVNNLRKLQHKAVQLYVCIIYTYSWTTCDSMLDIRNDRWYNCCIVCNLNSREGIMKGIRYCLS